MNIVFKSDLLNCQIDSNMSPLFLEQTSSIVLNKAMFYFNKKFKLNSVDFDELLTHLDGEDYMLVTKYKDAYNFLFKSQPYSKINMKIFSNILQKAKSCGVEISVE